MRIGCLPDFGDPLAVGSGTFWPVTGDTGQFVPVPDALDIAPGRGGRPLDFSLALVRGASPASPPAPHGVLDFTVRARTLAPDSLARLRAQRPGAVVIAPVLLGGFLRLRSLTPLADGTDSLGEPMRVTSTGLDTARFLRRLSVDEVTLLKRVLQDSALTFVAIAEIEVAGAAPRATGRLEVKPRALAAALIDVAGGARRLTRAQIVEFWRRDVAHLPIRSAVGFDEAGASIRADALADWTIARIAHYVPSTDDGLRPTVEIRESLENDADADEWLVWDLAVSRTVSRVHVLQLDPFEAARHIVSELGLSSLYTETIVPPVETGVVLLSVTANLPASVRGVLKLGVDLVAPPRPPLRIQPLTASLTFDDVDAEQTIRWRFSPHEDVAFQYSTFAIVRDGAGVRRLTGRRVTHTGPSLLVSVDDFPLDFIPIRANDALLAACSVHGTFSDQAPATGGAVTTTFDLRADSPVACLALPPDAGRDGTIALELRSLDGGQSLRLRDVPLAGLQLDLFSVPEYGPHHVAVTTVFDAAVPLVAVDLRPEPGDDSALEATTLAFTPDHPTGEFSYFARSIFQPGYRFRPRRSGSQPGEWSPPQSPFEGLTLRASAVA